MFTIEQAIENWKNNLREKQTLTESDIEELESHLHDEMERLASLGLSEEESFLVAIHRIGNTTQMAAEFAKVNTSAIWKTRFFWMIAGVLVLKIISDLSFFISKSSVLTEMCFGWFGWFGAGIFSSIVYGISLITLLLVFYFSITGNFWRRKISKFNTITAILSTWLLFTIGGQFLKTFPMLFIVKTCPPEQFGEFNLGMQYSMIAVNVLWALILLGLFILLRPKKIQTA